MPGNRRLIENGARGFTLLEVIVAACICGFVLLAANSVYKTQQKSYNIQEQISVMQQNLRGGICCMEREIRLAGYDPCASGNFGISDVRLDAKGQGFIKFTLDDNLNEAANNTDGNGILDALETIEYSLYDYPTASPDGISDLGRRRGANRQLVAEQIEAMGLAYAFDSEGDQDNALDRDAGGHVIWAIDSDGDNDLDVNLDADNDGDIDAGDEPNGLPLSNAANGGLNDVKTSGIRAVRIWLLARGERAEDNSVNTTTYVLANQRITPKDGIQRRLMTATVRCRNMSRNHNN